MSAERGLESEPFSGIVVPDDEESRVMLTADLPVKEDCDCTEMKRDGRRGGRERV